MDLQPGNEVGGEGEGSIVSDFGVMGVELGSNVTFLVRMRVPKVDSNSRVEFRWSRILGMGGGQSE